MVADVVSVSGTTSSEDLLRVFVCSTISDSAAERAVIERVTRGLHLTRPWLFENAPASADTLDESYLRQVRSCDIFVILVVNQLSAPVLDEWATACQQGKRRLVFVQTRATGHARVAEWIKSLDVRYDTFEDNEDLESKYACALSDELIRGYREFRLRHEDLRPLFAQVERFRVSFIVRSAEADELISAGADFPELETLYPKIKQWLDEKSVALAQGRAQALVATYGTQKAGLAITSDKEEGVRKISTLILRPDFRRLGVGSRLLYDVLLKAVDDGIEKLYLTFAEERRVELEAILSRYGFQLEGVSPRRYRRGSWEWVWGKRLLHEVIESQNLPEVVRQHLFIERGFVTTDMGSGAFVAQHSYGSLGTSDGSRQTACVVVDSNGDIGYKAARSRAHDLGLPLIFVGERPSVIWDGDICLGIFDIETLLYPLLVRRESFGMLVPIREEFASRLIPHSATISMFEPTSREVRTDNVYYRSPREYQGITIGSPLLFYETKRRAGSSRLVGAARVIECVVAKPEELFDRYGSQGVYSLDQIVESTAQRGRNAGKALALKFDWYREVRKPVNCDSIRTVVPDFNPVTGRRLPFDKCLKLMRLAGLHEAH